MQERPPLSQFISSLTRMNCKGLSSRGKTDSLARGGPEGDPPLANLPSYARAEPYPTAHSSSPSPRVIEEGQYFSLGGVPSPRTGGLPSFATGVDDMFLNGHLMTSVRPMQLPSLPHVATLGSRDQQEYESVEAASLYSYGTLGGRGDATARSRSLEDVLGRHSEAGSRSPKLLEVIMPPSPRFSAADIEAEDDDEEDIKAMRSEDDGNDAGDEDTSFEEELCFPDDYVYGFYDESLTILSGESQSLTISTRRVSEPHHQHQENLRASPSSPGESQSLTIITRRVSEPHFQHQESLRASPSAPGESQDSLSAPGESQASPSAPGESQASPSTRRVSEPRHQHQESLRASASFAGGLRASPQHQEVSEPLHQHQESLRASPSAPGGPEPHYQHQEVSEPHPGPKTRHREECLL
ncbi:uncharacterized protein LOC121870058 [Homarus americanus]|uniref:uncharacterized protein LOC121870058 n=1 Tax=Homarus americanus TaxID=6706 RepID=UPI001C47BAED|nr:uncharacterized protein LOC121870058 [Homarus americanus]